MAVTLRNSFDVRTGDDEARMLAEQAAAADMGALRRGYEAGRIGTDINANLIDEAAARSAGRADEADALAQRTQALQQRQAMYAPRVGRVEDISGLRDAFSWAGTQMGQGVASMQDPVALTAAGTALGRVPGAVGKVAPLAGAAGAFLLNQRQMAGEHYGNLREDPTAMASLGAQGAYRQANVVGGLGGALDTILPGMAGRALGGAALKRGAAGMLGSSTGAKALGGMALEGATEVGQGEIGRVAQGMANPLRDTSGDFSDRINEFAGGAVGGAPFSAAGAMADAGYGRTARAGELVKEKAGEIVDLSKEKGAQVYQDSGLKGVVDLGIEGTKSVWEKAGSAGKAAVDYLRDGQGRINYPEAVKRAQADYERFKLSQDEADLLTAAPPEGLAQPELKAWVDENDARRGAYISERLAALEAEGVPEATQFLDAITSDDPVAQFEGLNQASEFLLQRNASAQVQRRSVMFQSAIGEFIQKGAARATRGAKAAGDAAVFTGLNVAEGVRKGLDGRKLNAQGVANPAFNYDAWSAWTEENGAVRGAHAVRRAAGRAQERSADQQFADAMKTNSQHATAVGELLAAQAEDHFRSGGWEAPGIGDYARSLGYEASDMAASWLRMGQVSPTKLAALAGDLNRVLGPAASETITRAAQSAAPEAQPFYEQLQGAVDSYEPRQRPSGLQDQMLALLPQDAQRQLLENRGEGAANLLEMVEQISRGRVPPAKRREIEKAFGADTLNRMLTIYGGTLEEGAQVGEVVDDRAAGAENFDVDRLSVNDDGEVDADGQISDFDQRQAERKMQRNSTPRMYMFEGQGANSLHSTDTTGVRKPNNPFDSADKPSATLASRIEHDARQLGFTRADGETPLPSKPRPRLVTAETPAQARELLAKKLGQMDEVLKNDRSGYSIDVVSAKEVLDQLGSSPTERLALFRDYMFQNARRKATSEKNPDPTGAADDVWQAVQAHALLVDEMRGKGQELGVPGGKATRATPGGDLASVGAWVKQNLGEKAYAQFRRNASNIMRAAAGRPTRDFKQDAPVAGVTDADRALVMDAMERFFASSYMVQAEQLSDRVPGQISAGEVMDMARSGVRIRSAAEGAARTEGAPNNAEGDLLNFNQPKGASLLGTSNTTLAIPTDRLVGWVRSMRREESGKEDRRSPDKKFVADLYEGISALQESGLVEGMPWVNGRDGKAQQFSDAGLPDALNLPTTTGRGANKREEIRKEHAVAQAAKRKAPGEGMSQERWDRARSLRTARDQRRGEDPFVADPLEGVEDNVEYDVATERPSSTIGTSPHRRTTTYADRGKARQVSRFAGNLEGDLNEKTPRSSRASERWVEPVAAPVNRQASRDKDGTAPLDTTLFQREGETEFKDQQLRGKGIETPKFENRMSAEKKAPERADALIETFRSQGVAAGIAAVHQRLRMSQRRGQEGGIQYAWPLAHALTPKNIGTMDLGPKEARQVALARSGLAHLIATSENLAQREKVAMAKAMADESVRGKITAQNAQAWLEKGAEMYRSAAAKKDAPKAEATPTKKEEKSPQKQGVPSVVATKAIAEKAPAVSAAAAARRVIDAVAADDYSYIKTDAEADAFIAAAKDALDRLNDMERRAEAAGTDLAPRQTEVRLKLKERLKEGSTYDWASIYPSWNGDSAKLDARVNKALGRAAPEVAAAGAPKSQPSPGGARKLSLLSTQVHNDLQKGGFAATHDSPIRHEGKFDWRRHSGKGDGNAVYGAGTYLSTDEVIHKGYKKIFSGQAPGIQIDGAARALSGPSPTYHVSVKIMPSQIMDWSAPLSEQSSYVKKRLEQAGFADPDAAGSDMYRALSQRLGSDAAASNHLQELGILGHSFGATPKRSPNYVIYDDSRIETNYVHFNQQKVNDAPASTDEQVKAAKEYLDRVLGKQFKSEFEAITGYSGEFIEAENLIKISTLTNAGVLNVARHEALHAFFSKFVQANPKAQRVLASLTDDPRVLRRLQALLKDEPAALQQLTDGEERLAYIYQFAMAGQLKLPHTPGATLMHKIRKFLRRVFQMVSDQERAVDLLYAFEHGKMSEPSAAARALAKTLDQGTWVTKGARSIDAVTQRVAAMTLPANTILAESASPTARALARQFFTNPGEEGAGQDEPGYLNARNQQMRRYDNLFRKAIGDLDKRQLDELADAMQTETPTADVRDPDVAKAKEQLHALFERFYRYLTDEKGLRLGKINEAYFPVVYDVDKVRDGGLEKLLLGKYRSEVRKMASTINSKNAELNEGAEMVSEEDVVLAIISNITRTNPLDDAALDPQREDGVLRPWFASGEKRVLNFLDPEDRAQFQEKDLVRTLSRYVRQGVRTAEYASRFGRQGAVLDRQLNKIRGELEEASKTMLAGGDLKDEKAREKWVLRQYRDVANAVGGMEGSLGHDVSETVRKINSWSVVYQNVRLLPLALFSSFVDPLGIVARGGEMREAFTTFMDGMKGVARQWGDMIREEPAQRQKDRWEELAEHAGVIDAATFSHLLADEYGSVYLDGTAKKINEIMFKANGMEAWNRAMRVGATRSAVRFMERHNKGGDAHSARWMRELGFEVGGLPLDADGRLITDKRVMLSENPDMEMAQAEALIAKVHGAINRWVEGAILSPNAAQRPAWGSDPHFSAFWHLKQFAYSFHETIMKRALNEARQGNVMPLGVFAWYIPTMIAADVTKGLMLGAGELPAYMKGYDLGDWVLHGVDRAGVLGIGQVAIDGVQEPLGLAGPMVEQISDIFVQPAEQNIVKALPANSLYSRAIL